MKEQSIVVITPRRSVPSRVKPSANKKPSQEVPHNLKCPAHIVGYFHHMISKPAQPKMQYVESARNVAFTRGSADLFKSPWYLNSQSTNSRRIVLLNISSWEQLGEMIRTANGALTSKWKVNQFHSLLIQVQRSLLSLRPYTKNWNSTSTALRQTSERSCWQ